MSEKNVQSSSFIFFFSQVKHETASNVTFKTVTYNKWIIRRDVVASRGDEGRTKERSGESGDEGKGEKWGERQE